MNTQVGRWLLYSCADRGAFKFASMEIKSRATIATVVPNTGHDQSDESETHLYSCWSCEEIFICADESATDEKVDRGIQQQLIAPAGVRTGLGLLHHTPICWSPRCPGKENLVQRTMSQTCLASQAWNRNHIPFATPLAAILLVVSLTHAADTRLPLLLPAARSLRVMHECRIP